MKHLFFYFILALGLTTSCGVPSDITLPNKNITITHNILNYKEKPYSGKISMNLVDKISGYEGFINIKEGNLNGLTELKNEKKQQHVKFNIVEGKFDGDIIMNDPEQNVMMELKTTKGVINKMVANLTDPRTNMKQLHDLSFTNNLASGIMEVTAGGNTQKFEFKEGIAKLDTPQGAIDMKLSINPESGDMTIETSHNGKTLQNQTIPNKLTPTYIQQHLYSDILRTNFIK